MSMQSALPFPFRIGVFLLGCGLLAVLIWGRVVPAATATPSVWTWQPGPDLNYPRYNHTATLLPDGRVVVIGGITDTSNATRLNSAEVYDPATNSWTLYANGSNSLRNQHTATLLKDGRILVVGGDANFGGVVNSAEIFDPVTGTWTPVASPGPMANHAAARLNDGSVLVLGGYSGYTGSSPDFLLHAMRYNVAANTWTFAGQHDLYEAIGVTLGDGRVIAVARGWGGWKLYNPADNSWTILSGMPPVNWDRFWGVSATAHGGGVYFAGYGEAISYNAGWSGVSTLLRDRAYHAATSVNGGVMLVGGWKPDYSIKYTEAEVGGATAGHLGVARTWHTATTLQDGRVLVVGGQGSGVTVLGSTEIGEPAGFATATPTPTFTVTPTPTRTPTPTLTPTATATPRTDGVIAGRVWVDEGAWAVQDGEPGLAGIPVALYTNQGGHLVGQTVTGAGGHYTFTNLAAAPGIVYHLALTGPAGHAFVEANAGGDDRVDSDVDRSQPIDLNPEGPWVGQVDVPMDGSQLAQTDWDAGVHRNVMGGRVWWDWNAGVYNGANGIQDAGEPGFAGVEVVINQGEPPLGGSIVRTVTTDAGGVFTATNLAPGRYWAAVLFDQLGGPGFYWRSEANQGNDDTVDSEALAADCYPAANCPFYTPAITLPTNGPALRQDFGIVARGQFRLQAWEWWTQNGVPRQAYMPIPIPVAALWDQPAAGGNRGERPLANLTVQQGRELYGLAAGRYRFVWSKPAGYLIRPGAGYSPTEPDPASGSAGPIPIPVQTNSMGLGAMSEIYYYRPGASGPATPDGGGSVNTGGSVQRSAAAGRAVSLIVPPGAVTETVTLHLTDLAASALITGTGRAPGHLPTDYGFLWEVTVDGAQQGDFALALPATATLSGIGPEVDLAEAVLRRWDLQRAAWVDPAQDCAPAQPFDKLRTAYVIRNTSFQICRSGRYGVFAPTQEIFLPVAAK